ncbi:uncharacterized protein PHALS_05496 [Plasmopara halstedii]|uniref:Uncharacterized protein n=1 Tax=Plasmopara halstedii TaxID=4781 RepID=A0A0P1AZU4_PLAHL|nr:uncharacterized protein PHALS_05496 [Plasmopara halstedii]CEG48015.1 hypothetical protein PHALS_05496 [Plasmopara halstedii]|eukprot:XP_024584384.1 hypothetical protein PHALS_05496 [Plasmopara halstedii]
MADSIISLLGQNPTAGIAVGGALVAAAIGLTAAKALSSKAAPESKEKASSINLEEFVDDGPDSEEEEAIRAEKRKLKLKQKKKNAKAKQRLTASSSGKSAVDVDKEKEKKKAAAAVLQQEAEDGWETVVNKKKSVKTKTQ